jgi:ABC-type amino acid transport substrate-binding protein
MDRLLDIGVLRVGIRVWPEADFGPPAFRGIANAGGGLAGFEVDIAHEVADGLGLELELVEASPRVITSGDWRGGWDIAMASLVPFEQPLKDSSAHNMVYSTPYGYIPMGLLIPAANDNIQTLAQLSGRRVGVLEHSAYQRLLTPEELPLTVQGQPLMPEPPRNLQLIVISNMAKAIRELGQPAAGQTPPVEVIFGPIPVFQASVERDFPVKLAPETIGFQPLAIAVVPQDGLTINRLISEINKVLDRLQRQGVLAEIYLRWYEQDLSQPTIQ